MATLLFCSLVAPRWTVNPINPLAMVFQPFVWPRRFRFYAPFKAFKHGRPKEVETRIA